MRFIWIATIFWIMLYIPVSYAVVWDPLTALEVRQLPDYCQVKYREMHGDTTARSQGFSLMGPQYANVHHYCDGLNYLNRYYRHIGGQDAASYLSFAINEFTYMADHIIQPSSIEAEIFFQRALAYSLARNDSEAIIDLQRALTLNPQSVRTYIKLADLFSNMKARNKALDVITDGLRQIPDSKVLKRRYDELGGKQPYPEAVAAAPAPQQTESEEKPTVPATIHEPSEPTAAKQAGDAAAGEQGDATPSSDSKNPWCRFCAN
jgi:tetratricopeptide (TPR) repeat protein